MLTSSQILKLRAIIETAGSNRPPALTHGDLRLKNILVDDDGRITSIGATVCPAFLSTTRPFYRQHRSRGAFEINHR